MPDTPEREGEACGQGAEGQVVSPVPGPQALQPGPFRPNPSPVLWLCYLGHVLDPLRALASSMVQQDQ